MRAELAAIMGAAGPRPDFMMIGSTVYGPDGKPCAMPPWAFGPEIAEEYNREFGYVVASDPAEKS